MMDVTDKQFEELINQSIDEMPQDRIEQLNNVAITFDNEPTDEQRVKLKLNCNETLFGLYEGIPLTKRGAGYNMVLPDKITIFKGPISRACNNIAELKEEVKHTLWHEIAHYYGLDHAQIHKLDRKPF